MSSASIPFRYLARNVWWFINFRKLSFSSIMVYGFRNYLPHNPSSCPLMNNCVEKSNRQRELNSEPCFPFLLQITGKEGSWRWSDTLMSSWENYLGNSIKHHYRREVEIGKKERNKKSSRVCFLSCEMLIYLGPWGAEGGYRFIGLPSN